MLEFKKIEKSMLDECVDLFIETFSKEPWNDKYDSREQVVTFFKNYYKSNYFLGYVLKENDKIIALSIGEKKPWIKGMEYYIDQFCVKKEFQGKGIGSKFMSKIYADIKNKGLVAILLATERGYPSEKFYIKNGFEEEKGLITFAL